MTTDEAFKQYRNEQQREYRAQRKTQGKTLKGGEKPKGIEKFKAKKFVAYDSEGINVTLPDGRIDHRTSYFANSECDVITYQEGIPCQDAFRILIPWLYETGLKHKDAIKVFYFGGYDWTMILRGLSQEKLQEIKEKGAESYTYIAIDEEVYKIKIRFKQKLVIDKCRLNREDYINECYYRALENQKPKGDGYGGITFFDVGSFYQQSFIKTIEKILGPSYPLLELIKQGKNNRGNETYHRQETAEYCQAELTALVKICENLRDDLVAANLAIREWAGPGNIASAIIRREKLIPHINPKELFYIQAGPLLGEPTELGNAVLSAFYGGRIEMIQCGTAADVHDYDLVSCYPYFTSLLPSFNPENGHWTHTGPISLDDLPATSPYSLFHIHYKGSKKLAFHPFSHRDRTGMICRPPITGGWHHKCEVEAALTGQGDYYPQHLVIHDCWQFIPNEGTGVSPWKQAINDLFEQRRQFKKEGNGAEKILKLGINSLYGKTAQRIGSKRNFSENELKIPPTQDLFIAGFITANARATLYRAAMKNPAAVISFATDGITLTQKIDKMNLGSKLGQWEYNHYDLPSQFIMAGCYNLQSSDKPPKLGNRGYRTGHPMSWYETIYKAWQQGLREISITQTIFYSLGLALARKEPLKKLGAWELTTKTIKLHCLDWKRTSPRKLYKLDKKLYPTIANELPVFRDLLSEWDEEMLDHVPQSCPSKVEFNNNLENQIDILECETISIIASMQGESFNDVSIPANYTG